MGQTGAVLTVDGASREQALATAYAAERLLFDRGVIVTVVEDSSVAERCAAAGLVALWVRSAGTGATERTTSPAEAERDAAALVEGYEAQARR
jgi:hypothetical protein